MGIKIRIITTASKKKAVQVVEYNSNKRTILKHIGTANSEKDLLNLKQIAQEKVIELGKQTSFLKNKNSQNEFSEKYVIQETRNTEIYEVLSQIYNEIGFSNIKSELLKDMAITRVVKPASIKQTVEYINELFGIERSINTTYKNFKHLQKYKSEVESYTLNFARNILKQNVKVLFYDVTTLYFESFSPDELRKMGFSKDNKFNQPQIVIGLVTTNIGFPITYQMFAGNKFEGHSMLPTIKGLAQRHKVKQITVVADAAMISKKNVLLLQKEEFSYIVGARLANMQSIYLKKIYTQNKQVDMQVIEIKTGLGRLIVQFSSKKIPQGFI